MDHVCNTIPEGIKVNCINCFDQLYTKGLFYCLTFQVSIQCLFVSSFLLSYISHCKYNCRIVCFSFHSCCLSSCLLWSGPCRINNQSKWIWIFRMNKWLCIRDLLICLGWQNKSEISELPAT